ncbi:hypothetical protein CIHG_00518 [Coccidioides immitis H538.4]|uniref:Uncharacterized protein n=1 Tax=Coccidioides immitis H538.4 TaxID=396776 RepID=A0A0J8RDV6_COCIT|nr:hypothetical protein CIHG_00518 [Coccidioides immitis H538.4]
MEVHTLFQLTASAAACLISGGGGHAVWLSSIARRVTWRPASLNQTAVLCQAGVGLLVFAGSVASLVLAVYEPVFNKDEQQSLDLHTTFSIERYFFAKRHSSEGPRAATILRQRYFSRKPPYPLFLEYGFHLRRACFPLRLVYPTLGVLRALCKRTLAVSNLLVLDVF